MRYRLGEQIREAVIFLWDQQNTHSLSSGTFSFDVFGLANDNLLKKEGMLLISFDKVNSKDAVYEIGLSLILGERLSMQLDSKNISEHIEAIAQAIELENLYLEDPFESLKLFMVEGEYAESSR